jgi:NADPH:quinone reductase-like Zn-dependent oxidoreductase
MKAAVIKKYGGEEVVSIEETADPKPQAGEVVIQVRCAALNHLDIWVRNGRGGPNLAMPHVLGSDASGIVIDKAPDVQGVSEGDEVIINPGLNCGHCEFCLDGQQSECVSFGIVGMVRPGTFAEKIAVPACNVYPKPAHLEFNEAAALPLAYVTAWRMLFTRAKLKASDTILINGIGGGVALACLQFAALTGAEVIVTSSSDDKIEKAKKMGAVHGINYKTNADVKCFVMELTSKRGVDLVVTTVGAAAWETDLSVVRRGGKIVICGVTTGASAQTDLQRIYWNQITILGSTMGSDEDFRQMLKAAANTKLKPVIDSVYPLDEVSQAMKKMERGEQFGKIVLDINV